MEDGDPKGCRARRKLCLHVRCVNRRGVVEQHSSLVEVAEVVPPAVPGRTIGVPARLEGNV